jgi:DnaK suppressor protein
MEEQSFIDGQKQILEEKRNTILKWLDFFNLRNRESKGYEPKDTTEIANGVRDRYVTEGECRRQENKLKLTERSLKKIEEGTYSICDRKGCGKEIPQGRHEAIPEAILCVDCEKKSKR